MLCIPAKHCVGYGRSSGAVNPVMAGMEWCPPSYPDGNWKRDTHHGHTPNSKAPPSHRPSDPPRRQTPEESRSAQLPQGGEASKKVGQQPMTALITKWSSRNWRNG